MPRITSAFVVSSDYGEPLLASCAKATWIKYEIPGVSVFVEHNGRTIEVRSGESATEVAGRWEEGCGDG